MKVTTDACLFGAWAAREIQAGAKQSKKFFLDIGTGTGLLSLMVAQKNEELIDAVEIDAGAAKQAKENCDASPWKERITVYHADVLRWQPPHQYDCIVCNPPFYESDLKSGKEQKNLAHHGDGLKLADLMSVIGSHLKADGSVFLLLPAKRNREAEKMMAENGLHIRQNVFVKQTQNHLPFRVMMEGKKDRVERKAESTLVIADGLGGYTFDFIGLLKDYYFYL